MLQMRGARVREDMVQGLVLPIVDSTINHLVFGHLRLALLRRTRSPLIFAGRSRAHIERIRDFSGFHT